MKNCQQLELNKSFRKKYKFLSIIEKTTIEILKRYEVYNITYSANEDMSGKYLEIEFKTGINKILKLQFAERENDGVFIWPPFIFSNYGVLDLYEYLKYRELWNEYNEFNKYRIFGNINSSKEEINEKLHNYLEVLLSVLKIDEVDKLIHTDYWIEVPVDYKEWG